MANINDYIKWRGDLPIDKNYIFNELDSMILARFSYLIFDKIDLEEKETIATISEKMKDFKNEEFRYNGDKELITNLGESIRFKDMIVTDFVQNNNKDTEKQFSAITIHISEKEMYISYLGTDDSIYGWKEDFNLAFMENIPAQLDGTKYLKEIANKYNKKKIRVGGHSKGGNIAVFASVSLPKNIQKRIIKIYNYDGPGLNNKIIDNKKNINIIEKVSTYIPQDSIIGRILEHEEKYIVVKSIEKGILQHDIFSWQVMRDDVIKLEHVTKGSEVINHTIRNWLEDTTVEQRKIFINGVFELFYATSSSTINELSESWIKSLRKIAKTYKEMPENDRKIMHKMLKEFGRAYFKTFKDNES